MVGPEGSKKDIIFVKLPPPHTPLANQFYSTETFTDVYTRSEKAVTAAIQQHPNVFNDFKAKNF
jgi:hypothetical protein